LNAIGSFGRVCRIWGSDWRILMSGMSGEVEKKL
jgi:hypothetical protein